MIRLQPEWIGELASSWARDDWGSVSRELGYPDVSPMFKRIASVDSSEDAMGYSSAEVRAMAAAMEWLHLRHYEHWRALVRMLRPHLRGKLLAQDNDEELAMGAGKMLAEYIDKVLG
jgi:hypothetical protein